MIQRRVYCLYAKMAKVTSVVLGETVNYQSVQWIMSTTRVTDDNK